MLPAVLALSALSLAASAPSSPGRITASDLSPLLQTAPGTEALAAYHAGRFSDAARLLAGSSAPAARYVRALALAEAGRSVEALRVAHGLEDALPELSDRIATLRGQELLVQGKQEQAVVAFAGVPDGSLLAPEARIARARTLEALGDRPGALAALEPLLGLPAPTDLSRPDPGAPALLLAGRIRAAARPPDAAGARAAWLECWAGHPLAPEAAECRSALAALPGDAGAPPPPEVVVWRAEGLLEANRSDAALALLRALLPGLPEAAPDQTFACRVRSALGRAYRRERRHDDVVATLRPVVDRCQDPALRERALFVLAGSAAASGQREEAIELFGRLAREYPASPLADDALFLAAGMMARDGDVAGAAEALGTIAREHPAGDYRDEARFQLAWLARSAGESDAAIAQLLAIEESERDVDPYEHARAAYWRARLLAARGPAGVEAAQAIWTGLASRYPADYYGLLSRARLRDEAGDAAVPRAMAVPPAQPPTEWDAGALRHDRHFRAGLTLLRIGLPRPAADELNAVDPALLAGEGADPVLLVAELLDRAGDHRSAHQLLRTIGRNWLRRPPDGTNARVWRIAYPPAYLDVVTRWARAAGVQPELLLAVMREESALDPRVVSPAGAVGLTQLMLPTAQNVARRLKIHRPTRADLMQPPVNIRIGARYLADLLERYDGSAALALAAYNAGMGAVGRWLTERGGLALDEFVEEIPYEETRGYVKRVLRSYAAYRMLYGQPLEEALTLQQKLPGT